MNTNPAVPINARLARAIASVDAVPKDGANPMFKSKYMTLDGVLSVVKPALAGQNLVLTQLTSYETSLNATLCHTRILATDSGEDIPMGVTCVPMVKLDPQAMGSASTYARRYALMGIFSLEADDDDGNAASNGAKSSAVARTIPGAQSAHTPKAHPVEAAEVEEDPFVAGTYESHLPPAPKLTPARPVPQKAAVSGQRESKIAQFIKKEGVGDKGPWIRWDMTFADGTKASTFSEELADLAADAYRKGLPCAYDVKPPKNPKFGGDLLDLTPVIYQDNDSDSIPGL